MYTLIRKYVPLSIEVYEASLKKVSRYYSVCLQHADELRGESVIKSCLAGNLLNSNAAFFAYGKHDPAHQLDAVFGKFSFIISLQLRDSDICSSFLCTP